MNNRIRPRPCASMVLLSGLLCGSAAAVAAPGHITHLGAFGDTESYGYAVNNSGTAVGYSFTPSYHTHHAFKHDRTSMTDLGALGTAGAGTSWAHGINDAGTVVGWATISSGRTRAFRHDGTGMTNLGTLGGIYSAAKGINDTGTIVGISYTSTGDAHAFKHDGAIMTDLGTLGGARSEAFDVNDSGTVVGFAYNPNGEARAFKHDGTGMTDLGTLGGNASQAWAINAGGTIVGWSYSPVATRAFKHDGTTMIDLGTFDGQNYSFAFDINDSGTVVGYASSPGGPHRGYEPALWTSDNTIVNLNDWLDHVNPTEGSKWLLHDARSISDSGFVTGYGSYQGDSSRAYVLDVSSLIPEPTSAAGFALGALGLLRRRARRQAQRRSDPLLFSVQVRRVRPN